ncbi:hypothetical protein HWV62_35081 [Athelia sp. TMB]|nr:hypothetical protein HWV62_35081 [Athelia sp. TMB]
MEDEWMDMPPVPPVTLLPPPTTRIGRAIRFPSRRYVDFLPSRARGIPHIPPAPQQPTRQPTQRSDSPDITEDQSMPTVTAEPIRSEPNEFGVYRVYPAIPTSDPDEATTLNSVSDSPNHTTAADTTRSPTSIFGISALAQAASDTFAPFLNKSVFLLMNWFYKSNSLSLGTLDTLVNDVILDPGFDVAHLQGFRAEAEMSRLDAFEAVKNSDGTFSSKDGWRESTVKIRLPSEKSKYPHEENAPLFEVPGLHRRDIMSIVETAYQGEHFAEMNTTPYKEYVQRGHGEPAERVWGETYTADVYYKYFEEVQQLRQAANDTMEYVIAGIQIWSDSTHLANFGTASLWPVYIYFCNVSKYIRAKPTAFASHHAAYIPSLPDNLEDAYAQLYGKPPSEAMKTHLKRDLMQGIWDMMLDDRFMHAYTHGLPIQCADGIWRRVFPRLITYSADYPEKYDHHLVIMHRVKLADKLHRVLLAGIKNLGKCPCPRCLVTMDQVEELGTKRDRDRREKLERIDTEQRQSSLETARGFMFTRGDGPTGKAVDDILGPESRVPTRNTFSQRFLGRFNYYRLFVVDLLHEFELGVFKAVFTHLIRILYTLPGAVQSLDERYRKMPTFGRDIIRKFDNNVSAMKKLAARDFEDILQVAMPCFEGLLPAPFDGYIQDLLYDLATWLSYAKLRMHTDSTLHSFDAATTSLGTQLRKFSKTTSPHFRTKETPREQAARARRIATKQAKAAPAGAPVAATPAVPATPAESKWKTFNLRTYKAHALGDYLISIWLYGTTDSYSTRTHFLPKLRAHILNRLTGADYSGDEVEYTDEELHSISFVGNKLYRHKVARVNFTTYDMRRDQDSFNPRAHADFMTLAHEEPAASGSGASHPDKAPAYWYGRIIGIFHADVVHKGPLSTNHEPQHIEFMWVRWFGDDRTHRSGVKAKRLPRVGFVPDEPGHEPFGFLDPMEIIRAVHLMPAFAHGATQGLLGHSIARQPKENDEDWQYFYVDIWADRDMFMRFRGGGIGHKALRPIEDLLDGADVESPEDTTPGTTDPIVEDQAQPDEEDDDDDGDDEDGIELVDEDEEALGPEDGEDQEDIEDDAGY